MGLFQKKIGPVFLKEDSDATIFIEKMQKLESSSTDAKLSAEIQKQIKLAKYGEIGEKNISFELQNSGLDMYILHDLYLEYGELSAQIDYLVITRQKNYVIECKNLIGDIEIDNQGNFIRTYELNGKKVKEGIYSPITQNQRHLEILKNVRKESKGNFITKSLFERYFSDNYVSLVVLANPKTVLNAKYAKKEIKEQVIRADQIIARIKAMNASSKDDSQSENEMLSCAEFFLAANKTERSDYARKYEELVQQVQKQEYKDIDIKTKEIAQESTTQNNTSTVEKEMEKICPKCGKKMVLRTALKGQNAGNKFWGCSGFPNCRNIENI